MFLFSLAKHKGDLGYLPGTYLAELEATLFSEGLHTLGESPKEDEMRGAEGKVESDFWGFSWCFSWGFLKFFKDMFERF